jgi:hypothetical protein
MIRTRTLKKRVAHGYAWIRDRGHLYDLDVNRLHSSAHLLDACSGYRCPLAIAYTGSQPRLMSPYTAATLRLHHTVQQTDTMTRRITNVDTFLVDHGFDLTRNTSLFLSYMPFAWATRDRDWRILSDAWREVIATNADTVTPVTV